MRDFDRFFIAGQVLNRWTALPLSFFLRPAREGSGQGALVAQQVSGAVLAVGTALAFAISALALWWKAVWTILAAVMVTALTGFYYRNRIGGVTGDCMGATNQIAEVAVYFTGVLLR